ncbi:C-type lectin domain family 4 member A-like [Grammomys surdaster]|uniref:C-type lectin domain family 4 member A-like n=1 Tax=Grammomys surdaster TaxID=491861 RepID=UPI00109F444B|nr:C-type lectin domain family 4 member A-like [Grammomys surdaster]
MEESEEDEGGKEETRMELTSHEMNVLLLLAPRKKHIRHLIYFQKYSQLLEEKKAIKNISHNELNCTKEFLPMEDKVWSCCPKDWKLLGSHCYLVLPVTSTDSAASWMKSEEKCSQMGAHLLVIHSQKEQDFITNILNTRAAYFIGLRDSGQREWQWVDQTPYNESATSPMRHTLLILPVEMRKFSLENVEDKKPGHPFNVLTPRFWHKGEPNSDNEKCVTLNYRLNAGWGWNDIPCNQKQKSVCQMKKIYL